MRSCVRTHERILETYLLSILCIICSMDADIQDLPMSSLRDLSEQRILTPEPHLNRYLSIYLYFHIETPWLGSRRPRYAPPPPTRRRQCGSPCIRALASPNSHVHCKEDSNHVFPEIKLRGLVPNFHIHTSVNNLYIPRIGSHILLQPNRQTYRGNI